MSDPKEVISVEVGNLPKIPACGSCSCGISTGIHGGLTFGKGELDDNGYWEFPCAICEQDWLEKNPIKKFLVRRNVEYTLVVAARFESDALSEAELTPIEKWESAPSPDEAEEEK